MLKHVELATLSAALQKQVLAEYFHVLKQEDRRLTYKEAAWLYGYTVASIRAMVWGGRLRTVGRSRNKRITHNAMRTYIRSRGPGGKPRTALLNSQLQLN